MQLWPFAAAVLSASCAFAQPRFEVASMRPSKAADSTNRIGPTPQGGLRAENVTVTQLIALAYGVRPFLIVDAPGWAASERFDVLATPDKPDELPQGATPAQRDTFRDRLRQRLQSLLAERCGLVVKTESRVMPVFKLTVARGGHKMTPAAGNEAQRMQSNSTMVQGTAVEMRALADSLTGLLLQPVLDETGLSGPFTFAMQFSDIRLRAAPESPVAETGPAAPTIYTAIVERLGLRLDSTRAPAPVFVVQKLQRPSEN